MMYFSQHILITVINKQEKIGQATYAQDVGGFHTIPAITTSWAKYIQGQLTPV